MSLDVTVAGGLTVSVPPEELLQPLRGIGPRGEAAVNEDFVEVQIFRDSNLDHANDPVFDAPVFPRAFLSQVGRTPYLHIFERRPPFFHGSAPVAFRTRTA
jgi:hypothetical protein